jgi:Protein of unknown function (DUF1186)/SEC-C motif
VLSDGHLDCLAGPDLPFPLPAAGVCKAVENAVSEQPSEAFQILVDEGLIFGSIQDHLAALSTQDRPDAIAIFNCLARPEEAWPRLRSLVERAAEGQWLSRGEVNTLFHGLHILGGGRDSAACRPVLRLLRRPPEHLDELLGIAIGENLAQIIAGVFDAAAEALFALIAEPSIDEYVRDAAFGAATFLTRDGRIDRDLMIAFLVRFNDERPALDGDYGWVGWLEAIALLGLRPLAPLAYQAMRDGRVPPDIFDRDEFESDLRRAELEPDNTDGFDLNRLGYMEDVLVALDRYDYADGFGPPPADEDPWEDEPLELGDPVINPLRHVGRNDPCPCGSGKKAKKCCLEA